MKRHTAIFWKLIDFSDWNINEIESYPRGCIFWFRAPLPSEFPEPLTPPPVRFSSMPTVVGVWIFSGITHYCLFLCNKLTIHSSHSVTPSCNANNCTHFQFWWIFKTFYYLLPGPQGFRPEGEISRRHPRSLWVYTKYLQLKYAVSIPEKTLIYLIRGCIELLGNDDVCIVHSCKYEMVRMM